MALKFPEKVFARMIRIAEQDEVFLLRKDTMIQFGNASHVLGVVIMTNPGSFSFRNSTEWNRFQNGNTSYTVFEAYDKPDLTMQNVIEVIRKAYGGIALEGIVQILNISNIVESKKENVEEKHKQVLKMIQDRSNIKMNYLVDPVVHEEYEFIKYGNNLDFIILGFADKVFPNQVSNITAWLENPAVKNKVVFAKDKIGRLSHPRRWRTERELSNIAVERLKEVLKENNTVLPNQGYTFLRWNGMYGSDAKFVVRDNARNFQSIFVPGRTQDLLWTSSDLANDSQLQKWSTFENETVDNLEHVAF